MRFYRRPDVRTWLVSATLALTPHAVAWADDTTVPATAVAADPSDAAAPPAAASDAASDATTPTAAEAHASKPEAQPAPPTRPKFELALGLRGGYGPEYTGSTNSGASIGPAIYVRYERFSISSASGLIDRRDDTVLRGLGIDLSRSEQWRVGVSLRYDQGRDSDGKEGLEGKEEIAPTVRVRAAVQRRFEHGWRVSAALTPDLLNRGGGTLVEFGASHEHRVTPDLRWFTGGSLSWGDARYMRSYFGINEQESIDSGLPLYDPSAGFRDAGLSTRMRWDVTDRWTVSLGAGMTMVLGPARDSPLTTDTLTFGVNAGAIYWLY